MANSKLIFLSLVILFACDRIMPGGLWDKFETDLRIKKESDQGPWGGTRTYFLRSKTSGHFNSKQILDFATSNGWTLVDSLHFNSEDIANQRTNNKQILRIQVGPFNSNSSDKFLTQDFPRWTNGSLKLYKFKTGWLIFYPGTDDSTETNGFITISDDGREMTVYHLWGE